MIFVILQIVVGLLLIFVILLQTQGGGLSNVFGGSGQFYRSRRSVEKILFVITIVLSSFFAILSLLLLITH